jgi:integrase
VAIDSKLRGCDVVMLRVEDLAPRGCAVDRATVRQKKTGRPVKFELTEQSREAVDNYLRASGKKPGQFLFASHRDSLVTSGRANTHDFFRIGSLASDLIRSCSVLILSGGLRRL